MSNNFRINLEYEYREQQALEKKLGNIVREKEACLLRADAELEQMEIRIRQRRSARQIINEQFRHDHFAHMKVRQYLGELEDELFKTAEDHEDRLH